MSDLVEFLRARLDEDEAKAREAIALRMATPLLNPELNAEPDYNLGAWEDVGVPAMLIGPERVLREVEAKRAVIEAHPRETRGDGSAGGCWTCDHDCETGGGRTYGDVPCATVRALANVYADHPDWAPTWTYARE